MSDTNGFSRPNSGTPEETTYSPSADNQATQIVPGSAGGADQQITDNSTPPAPRHPFAPDSTSSENGKPDGESPTSSSAHTEPPFPDSVTPERPTFTPGQLPFPQAEVPPADNFQAGNSENYFQQTPYGDPLNSGSTGYSPGYGTDPVGGGYNPNYGYQQPSQYAVSPYSQVHMMKPAKSKAAAALLAFFLGAFGTHNFYLGYTGRGIAQLLITVLTVGFFSWVSGIWALIEFIMILTGNIPDSDGRPLS